MGHAREKLHLPICACETGDLELIKKIEVSAISDVGVASSLGLGTRLMWPGLRNNEFTYHGLISTRRDVFVYPIYIAEASFAVLDQPAVAQGASNATLKLLPTVVKSCKETAPRSA